jgi:hypothetical protein
MSQPMIWTVSYRSEDALRYDDQTRTWTFTSGLNRLKMFRMTLVGLEFPISQRTVEPEWSRFSYSEGLLLTTANRRVHLIETVAHMNSSISIDVLLPLGCTTATVVSVTPGYVTVRATSNGDSVDSGIFVNGVSICDAWFRASLGHAITLVLSDKAVELSDSNVRRVDNATFEVTVKSVCVVGTSALITAPSVASPVTGSMLLTWIMAQYNTVNRYQCSFACSVARTTIMALGGAVSGSRLALKPSGFQAWLGFSSSMEVVCAGGVSAGVGWLGNAQFPSGGDLNRSAFEQVAIPSQSFNGFDYGGPLAIGAGPNYRVLDRSYDNIQEMAVQSNEWQPAGSCQLRPGWYTPVTRQTGQAESIVSELDLCMSPLRLPVPQSNQRLPGGTTSIHQIVLETPWGDTLMVPIQFGHYTPEVFAQSLQFNAQVAAANTGIPWTSFRVTFVGGSFSFRDTTGRAFALAFADPFMLDPRRIGFMAQRYAGQSAYKGSVMVLPQRDGAPWPLNAYTSIDGGCTRRIQISCTPPRTVRVARWSPPVTLAPEAHVAAAHGGEAPVAAAHGGEVPVADVADVVDVAPDDVAPVDVAPVDVAPVDVAPVDVAHVDVAPSVSATTAVTTVPTATLTMQTIVLSTWVQVSNDAGSLTNCPYAVPYQQGDVVILTEISSGTEFVGVVTTAAGTSALFGSSVVKQLTVSFPGNPMPSSTLSWSLRPVTSRSHFSLMLPLERGVPARLLGFPTGATLQVTDIGFNARTLVAPNLFDLEHVDFVLMDLGADTMRTSDAFQVAQKSGSNSVAFAKLVVYPQYQLHGNLPRDLVCPSIESVVTFSVQFRNPDGSLYQLNGRQFSFSLQYQSPSAMF